MLCDSFNGERHVATTDLASIGGNCLTAKYERAFALFTCHGILFENYVAGKNYEYERPFVHKVVFPAFHRIRETLNVKHLVVRLLEAENEDDLFWNWYPQEIEDILEMNGVTAMRRHGRASENSQKIGGLFGLRDEPGGVDLDPNKYSWGGNSMRRLQLRLAA
ncbi:MAG: hypothetical protein NTW03_00130 [Verrucomicrobia bacterium]|nr:hypothetical protein [Verrucomicrobiota bacterium]